jgi:hypothetical protein
MAYDHIDLNEVLLEGTPYGTDLGLEADDGADEREFGDLEGPDDSLAEFGLGEADDGLGPQQQEALAYELMGISSEREMDEFFGKLIGTVGKHLKRTARRVAPHALNFLKGPGRQLLAKALPLVGAAAGSVVPGLGNVVGGMAGNALGQLVGGSGGGVAMDALGSMLGGGEGEYGTLDEAKVDVAQRVVRTLSQAAAAAATDPRAITNPAGVARDSLAQAVQQNLPPKVRAVLANGASGGSSGRWIRRGNRIVVIGA